MFHYLFFVTFLIFSYANVGKILFLVFFIFLIQLLLRSHFQVLPFPWFSINMSIYDAASEIIDVKQYYLCVRFDCKGQRSILEYSCEGTLWFKFKAINHCLNTRLNYFI